MPHDSMPGTSPATAAFTAIDETLTHPHPSIDASGVKPADSTDHIQLRGSDKLPYWLVNIPRDRWPETCPEFLKDLSDKNISILATPDEEYRKLNWEEVKELVRKNHIGHFQRRPSDLRKYLEYMAYIHQRYGSVMRFVITERLHWGDGNPENVKPRGRPFEFADDLKILYNDWPYGIEDGIIHLVVWTKFELDDDPSTGDLTDAMRKQIDDFVGRTFRSRIPPDRVIWFKNWRSLKSIHAIEHFHVMLYQPEPEFMKSITNGDVPLIEKVSQ